jgi:hypothetical protein
VLHVDVDHLLDPADGHCAGCGRPVEVVGPTQTVTPTQRCAMAVRFRHCQWPGCVATRVDAHHRHHRAERGHDDIENLVPLCRYHHRQTHLRHITITLDERGQPIFTRPDGTVLQPVAPTDDLPHVDAAHAPAELFARFVATGADPLEPARYPRWTGDPLDLRLAIDAAIAARTRALRRTTAS